MLQINSKLFHKLIGKILSKSIKRTLGIDPNIDIVDMDIQWTAEDYAKGSINLNFVLGRKDVVKLTDIVTTKINA